MSLFQSHNGAIAACVFNFIKPAPLMFQSHNGAIAARARSRFHAPVFGFNPTMVRLLQVGLLSLRALTWVSIPQWCDCCQFRCFRASACLQVSIPQWCDCCFSPAAEKTATPTFQSHNGAIAASCNRTTVGCRLIVSIPQWCDCCYLKHTNYRLERTFQSHNGAIAAEDDFA